MSKGLRANIAECLQMSEGSLPVRYLGVSLISSNLSARDCDVLVQKISRRIASWLSKHLSFARSFN